MERGLRQGDHLAPFLFLVVAESLHLTMKEAKAKSLFDGIKVGKDDTVISHLQYADDVIFFGEWTTPNIKNLMRILKCFHAVSGLKLYLSKSKLYGVGVSEGEIQSWARGLGCGSDTLPFIYLGLPIGSSMRRLSDWKPVIDKLKNKLAEWKAKAISLYYFSLFRTPICVLKLLESVRCNFFWGGGKGSGEEESGRKYHAWVRWDKVLGSFGRGGLNIGGLKDANWGLLGKWW